MHGRYISHCCGLNANRFHRRHQLQVAREACRTLQEAAMANSGFWQGLIASVIEGLTNPNDASCQPTPGVREDMDKYGLWGKVKGPILAASVNG
jgi:hypothetical protein